MTEPPLPALPPDCRCIIVAGGTFDPVHLAHTSLAQAARSGAHLADACLLFVPASRSPFKADSPRAGDEDRVAMLKLALANVPRALIWTDELDRARNSNAPSYTVETLERLRNVLAPDIALRLLIGADQAASFHKWREPRKVLSLALPLVMLRGSDSSTLLNSLRVAGFWTKRELETWASAVVPTPLSPISSTLVRDLLAAQNPTAEAELTSCLDPAVLKYIRSRRLYVR